MKPILVNNLSGTFCELNDKNFQALCSIAELDKVRRNIIIDAKNLYISSDLKINKTTLNREELIKLNLKEIELIDGFWYYKSDKGNK